MKLIFENEAEFREFLKISGNTPMQIEALVKMNSLNYTLEDFSVTYKLTMPEFFQMIVIAIRKYVDRYQSWNKIIISLHEKVFANEKLIGF